MAQFLSLVLGQVMLTFFLATLQAVHAVPTYLLRFEPDSAASAIVSRRGAQSSY